jgi:hypothetical protein
MNISILFLIFNRPDTTQKVFEVIREAKPKQLFVSADGPRVGKEGEKGRCEETRNIIKQVDWDCEVKTLFRDENLGCGKAVSGAITWFFENVEEGIILEDDCLPNLSFFKYCEELLEKYRFEDRIFMISGDNFLPESLRLKESYYFTNFPHIWGWASWRRAWSKYSFKMEGFLDFVKDEKIKNVLNKKENQNYFLERFNEVYKGNIDTWDYQWVYSIWKNNGISIAPSVNLISNIGFGNMGTHTFDVNDISANLETKEIIFPMIDYLSMDNYTLGDDYESRFLIDKNYGIKKILKKIGLFNIIKRIYLFVK